MRKNNIKELFFQISSILLLIGAFGYFYIPSFKYVLLVGVAGFAATTLTTKYPGKSIRGKRLYNMQVFAAVIMIVSVFLLFTGYNIWILLLSIAAVLILYSSIVIPRELKKEENSQDK